MKYKTSMNIICRCRKYFFLPIFLLSCSAIGMVSHKETCPSEPELLYSACNGDIAKIAKIVGDRRCALDLRSKSGLTPMMCAVVKGHVDIVVKLLEGGSNPNLQNERGITALMLASANGYEKITSILLKNGADPNLVDNLGYTSLMYAVGLVHDIEPMFALKGRINVAAILIKSGADVNRRDKRGRSALFIAKQNNQVEIVKLLQAAGAKL